MKIIQRLSLAAALLLCSAAFAWSFSFNPLTTTLSPSGRGSSQSFYLNNNGEDFIALRIRMLSRQIDLEGNEERESADELFTVYPRRVVLKPGDRQTLKVQWKGPAQLQQERCFRILVEQLPVDFGEENSSGSGVEVQFRYLGSVYVTPAGAEPDVVVAKSRVEANADGNTARELVWTFRNRGGKHAILNKLHLTVEGDAGSAITYTPQELEGITGENLLPGGRRRFRIPLPSDFEGETADVRFDYQQVD